MYRPSLQVPDFQLNVLKILFVSEKYFPELKAQLSTGVPVLSSGRVLAADLPGHDRAAGLPLPAPHRLASGRACGRQERDILRWSEALS